MDRKEAFENEEAAETFASNMIGPGVETVMLPE